MTLAEQKSLQALASIKSEIDALAAQVEVVVKSAAIGVAPAQQQLKLLHELMTQSLLKLDVISGEDEVRSLRKAQIRRVGDLSAQLDRAEHGATGNHSPAEGSLPTSTSAAAPPAEKLPVVSDSVVTGQEGGNLPGAHEPPASTAPSPEAINPTAIVAPPAEPSLSSAPTAPPVAAATPEGKPQTLSPPRANPSAVVPTAGRQPQPSPPPQKSPGRVGGSAGGPAMGPPHSGKAPSKGQVGEDVRKKTAGMMSHALSLNDGLAPGKPPTLQPRQSLASSASASFLQHLAPKSGPTTVPSSAPTPAPVAPLAPTISDRLDNLRLSDTPAPMAHSGSLHDLDSFFGGGLTKASPPTAAASPGQPNFATFGGAAQEQHPSLSGAPALNAPSPAPLEIPVQYPSPSGPKLSFPSPPQPASSRSGPSAMGGVASVPAALGSLPGFAPPPARRSSSSPLPPDAPPDRKATSPLPATPPNEALRPQRRSDAAPALGNLSGFASPIPPPKSTIMQSPSPGASSYSPPTAALSSFSDLPSPSTRSTLSRPTSTSPAAPSLPPPPAPGVRSSLQATSIEEALRGALSRRESATKGALAELMPAAKNESAPPQLSGRSASAQGPSSTPPAQSSPAGGASSSSWVAFDSDFDPRAFSRSNKNSPSESRRSSYDLPPPPRPAQPLFPEAVANERPAEQGTAAAQPPVASLLDNTPPKAESALEQPAAVGAVPVSAQPRPPVSNPNASSPVSLEPPLFTAAQQPAPPQHPTPGPQSVPFAASPLAAPQFGAGTQGGNSTQQGASKPASGGVSTGSVQPRGGATPGGGQLTLLQQPGLGPQQLDTQRLPQQAFPQTGAGQQQAGMGGPASLPVLGSTPPGLTAGVSQLRPPGSAPVGARNGPLEGFGEIGLQAGTQPPVQPGYGTGWPQQGPAGYIRPGYGPVASQVSGPQGFAPSPGFGQGFGGMPPQQGLPYQYRPQGQAPWLQQPGASAPAGAGFGGFGGQQVSTTGGPGQSWQYQQQLGAGGQTPYQQPTVGGVAQFAAPQMQAPALAPGVGGYQGASAPGLVWPSNGGTAPQGAGAPPPAILPPWMIQPRQQAPFGGGSQGQGW